MDLTETTVDMTAGGNGQSGIGRLEELLQDLPCSEEKFGAQHLTQGLLASQTPYLAVATKRTDCYRSANCLAVKMLGDVSIDKSHEVAVE